MSSTIIEALRKHAIDDVFNISSFSNSWGSWRKSITQKTSPAPTPQNILDLGDHLSTIFQSTGTSGRSQGSVSGGGYGWEGLITWYLNLILANTRGVAVKMKKDLIPQPIREAITVNYGNIQCNTEADIIVIIFPEDFEKITASKEELLSRKAFSKSFNQLNFTQLQDFEVGIVQCKTNWNDNAQVPMLWNMVYSANNFTNTQISVGTNSHTISDFARFTYSFATVPSNGTQKYKITSTAVLRVNTLSGGNYWGHPSKNGIASSLKEIFNRNFRNSFKASMNHTISKTISELKGPLSYFNL